MPCSQMNKMKGMTSQCKSDDAIDMKAGKEELACYREKIVLHGMSAILFPKRNYITFALYSLLENIHCSKC